MALPVSIETLKSDIMALVRKTNLEALTSKFVRTNMETKHGVKLGEFKKQIDEIIRDSILKLETEKANEDSNDDAGGDAKNDGNESTKTDSSDDISSSASLSPAKPSQPPPPRKTAATKNGDAVAAKPSRKRSITPQTVFDDDDDGDKYSAIKRRRASQRTVQRKPAATKAKKTKQPGAAKKKTAFTRICALSDELSDLLNRKYLRRSDVVKLMWQYFRDNNLLDPKDRRYVIPNERLRPVLGAKRMQAFGMMKVLTKHIKDVDFLDEDSYRTAMREIEAMEENGELDVGPSTSSAGRAPLLCGTDSSDSDASEDESEKKVVPPPKTESIKAEPPVPALEAPAAAVTIGPTKPETKEEEPEPQTSSTQNSAAVEEEPRAGKLVLRISKKNERVDEE